MGQRPHPQIRRPGAGLALGGQGQQAARQAHAPGLLPLLLRLLAAAATCRCCCIIVHLVSDGQPKGEAHHRFATWRGKPVGRGEDGSQAGWLAAGPGRSGQLGSSGFIVITRQRGLWMLGGCGRRGRPPTCNGLQGHHAALAALPLIQSRLAVGHAHALHTCSRRRAGSGAGGNRC